MEMYGANDWRSYLAHKYDWSSGKNPSDYNHDYYEKHKEEILANRKNKNGAVRDFGGAGVGYKAKKDNTTGENEEDYENDDDWADELTDEEKKNIQAHNDQVEKNIAELTKTVNDYITANKDKLSAEQIDKLKKDLATQISIAKEQKINTKNSDDHKYVMDLRKKAADSSSSNSAKSSAKSSTKSTAAPKQTSSNTSSKKSQSQMKQEEYERKTEKGKKEAAAVAKQREAAKKNADNFNYDNDEARRRREEQERQKESMRKKK